MLILHYKLKLIDFIPNFIELPELEVLEALEYEKIRINTNG